MRFPLLLLLLAITSATAAKKYDFSDFRGKFKGKAKASFAATQLTGKCTVNGVVPQNGRKVAFLIEGIFNANGLVVPFEGTMRFDQRKFAIDDIIFKLFGSPTASESVRVKSLRPGKIFASGTFENMGTLVAMRCRAQTRLLRNRQTLKISYFLAGAGNSVPFTFTVSRRIR